MPVTCVLVDASALPAYQPLADHTKHMRELGMSYRAIGRALGVDYKIAIKAIAWIPLSE